LNLYVPYVPICLCLSVFGRGGWCGAGGQAAGVVRQSASARAVAACDFAVLRRYEGDDGPPCSGPQATATQAPIPCHPLCLFVHVRAYTLILSIPLSLSLSHTHTVSLSLSLSRGASLHACASVAFRFLAPFFSLFLHVGWVWGRHEDVGTVRVGPAAAACAARACGPRTHHRGHPPPPRRAGAYREPLTQ
jgi:hypothetical protein